MVCKICKEESKAFIRGVAVCLDCFYILKADNAKRGEDITDLKILMTCYKCEEQVLDVIGKFDVYDVVDLNEFLCVECKKYK